MMGNSHGVTIEDVRALVVAHNNDLYRYLDGKFASVERRQDDMIAQQRLTNGRVLKIEQTCPVHATKIDVLDLEVLALRPLKHAVPNIEMRYTALEDALKTIKNDPAYHVEQRADGRFEVSDDDTPAKVVPFANIPLTFAALTTIAMLIAGVVGLVIWLHNHGLNF